MKERGGKKSDFSKITPGNWFVYFLRLERGFFYVGITKDVQRRLNQHEKGKGAKVTKTHHPSELLGVWRIGYHTYEEAEKVEDDFTLEFMKKYGDGVKGGRWADSQSHNIEKLLRKNHTTNPSERYKKEDFKYEFKALELKKSCTRKLARKLGFKELSRDESVEKLLDYWINILGITDANIEEARLKIDKRGFYKGGKAFLTKEQKEEALRLEKTKKDAKNISRTSGNSRKRCSRKRAFILGLDCLSPKESARKLLDWWVNVRGFSDATEADALWLVTQNGYYSGGICHEKVSIKSEKQLCNQKNSSTSLKKKKVNRKKTLQETKTMFVAPKLGVKTGVDGLKGLIKKI